MEQLPEELRNRVLSQISAHQAALWRRVSGDDPPEEDVRQSAKIWFGLILSCLARDNTAKAVTGLQKVTDWRFCQAQRELWERNSHELRVLKAQIWGLSEETARDLIAVLDNQK